MVGLAADLDSQIPSCSPICGSAGAACCWCCWCLDDDNDNDNDNDSLGASSSPRGSVQPQPLLQATSPQPIVPAAPTLDHFNFLSRPTGNAKLDPDCCACSCSHRRLPGSCSCSSSCRRPSVVTLAVPAHNPLRNPAPSSPLPPSPSPAPAPASSFAAITVVGTPTRPNLLHPASSPSPAGRRGCDRLGGRISAPTASHAAPRNPGPIELSALSPASAQHSTAEAPKRLRRVDRRLDHPQPHTQSQSPPVTIALPTPAPIINAPVRPSTPPPPQTPPGRGLGPPAHPPHQSPQRTRQRSQSYLQQLQEQSPFRIRDAAGSRKHSHSRSFSASRLWNPSNSTQGFLLATPPRPRRPSTPVPPARPISHPALDVSLPSINLVGAVVGAGDTPLLTTSERQLGDTKSNLHIDQSGRDSVSLPRSVRHSYDDIRSRSRSTIAPSPSNEAESEAGPSTRPQPVREVETLEDIVVQRQRYREQIAPQVTITALSSETSLAKLDKGKGKAIMASTENAEQQSGASFDRDLEAGPEPHRRDSLVSDDGIGSAILSSNSSIMGDPDGQADDEEWGPQHPCYPHLNPHVPIDSPEYVNTRIIRIKRDWLVEGDLAPTFSNMYPEILDPAGLSEVEFRRVIDKLNSELVATFDPYRFRNIVDGVLGLLTGWLWDDFGLTNAKARLARLERWIERWNKEMEKTAGGDDNIPPPKLVPLRQTAYMTLDIQIFDPEIQTAQSAKDDAQDAEAEMPAEPSTAVTAS